MLCYKFGKQRKDHLIKICCIIGHCIATVFLCKEHHLVVIYACEALRFICSPEWHVISFDVSLFCCHGYVKRIF
jgi:hypothetical protein